MRVRTGVIIFLASMLLFSWVFTVKPPFSSPDEGFHLSRADGILQGYFILKPISPDGSSGAKVDISLDKMANLFNSTLSATHLGDLNDSLEEMKDLKWSHAYLAKGMPNVSFYTPSVYLPQALGFYISKALDLNLYSSYLFTNVVTFAACLILLILAYYIYPIPLLTLVFLTIPMSVFQLMSPTIDGLSMAFTVLAMSCFMRLLFDKEIKNYNGLALLMSICIFSAAGSRANLLLMSLMPLWLFYKNRKLSNLLFLALCLVTTLSWTTYNLLNVHDAGMGRHPGYSNTELVIFYLKNPLIFFKTFFNTITDVNTLIFYLTSMIGVLGWLDAPISKTSFSLFFVIILTALVISVMSFRKSNDKATSYFIFILSALSLLLIFPALLAQWNSFPTEKIVGVQGRYFIIPALIFGYCFHTYERMNLEKLLVLSSILVASTYTVHSAISNHYIHPKFTFETINSPDELKNSRPINILGSSQPPYALSVPNGNISSMLIYFGNYNNKAKGTVNLKVCSVEKCQETFVNTHKQQDNSFYEFNLPQGLKVENRKITLKFNFFEDDNSSPLALWEYSPTNENNSFSPRIKINYIN
ncbi:DUF2142 domain-containing protein [Pantoea agglomerans]|uniref:DUF2142 domain-containing protein n=1 Tax=Enterobacter agglomerans TaxID=549 RepID=UPI001E44FBCF|nr:DUF2142 domain-containing protein [Pantoea agglomerans]UEG75881.1 DUF2142 domain-containing protein [Pantoea agglomerans]